MCSSDLVTTIAFIVHLPVWSLLSTYDGDATSPGAQRRYILNPRCRTGGHAFWNPELASAEDQYARCARIWLRTGELGWVAASGLHELTQLAFGLCSFQFFLLPSSELSQR